MTFREDLYGEFFLGQLKKVVDVLLYERNCSFDIYIYFHPTMGLFSLTCNHVIN